MATLVSVGRMKGEKWGNPEEGVKIEGGRVFASLK